MVEGLQGLGGGENPVWMGLYFWTGCAHPFVNKVPVFNKAREACRLA